MTAYNPSVQYQLCASREECFFGNYPTLGELKVYGDQAAKAWLYVQLFDLSEYCGCKEKLTEKQIEDCACIIAMRYPYLKISEIMLYLVNFKAGQYGKFYGSVDPIVITIGLSQFLRERYNAVERHQKELEEQAREEAMKTAITYEEFLALKNKKEQ